MNPDNVAIYAAYDGHKAQDSAEAEKNLMRAILRTAMEDIQKRGEPYRDARRYLMSNEDLYLYSFLSVCHHLELCHKTIRTIVGLTENANANAQADPSESPDPNKLMAA